MLRHHHGGLTSATRLWSSWLRPFVTVERRLVQSTGAALTSELLPCGVVLGLLALRLVCEFVVRLGVARKSARLSSGAASSNRL